HHDRRAQRRLDRGARRVAGRRPRRHLCEFPRGQRIEHESRARCDGRPPTLMIRRLIQFSAHNRWLVISLTAAAVAYAVYTWNNIRLDAVPDLSDTQVIVFLKWDRSP